MLPLPIQFFGLARQGKTTYLAALAMALQRVNAVWNGFTAMAATEPSQRLLREVNTYFETGRLPPASVPGVRDCYLILMNRVPKWVKVALMVRDCPGKAFQGIDVDVKEASFLLKAPLTFMFISLADLKELGRGDTLDTLMNGYINTLVAHGARLEVENRKVVVVLTKADLLGATLPIDLLSYIEEDPIWKISRLGDLTRWYSLAEMDSYLQELARISRVIEEWICRQAAGRMLVTLARDRNIELQFSLVSSTGAAPRAQDNVLSTRWEPSRVLDPFLWALELDSRRRIEMDR